MDPRKNTRIGITRTLLASVIVVCIVVVTATYAGYQLVQPNQKNGSQLINNTSSIVSTNTSLTSAVVSVTADSSKASDGNQPISLTVIPANGSSISWMWIKTSLQLRVTVQYAREVGPPITAAGTGSPSGLQFAVTSLYVKNLSPDAMLFNPDLSLLARFAFSNGTDVSRFLGSMQLDASQERNQTDFMLVPSTDTLQNVTIVEAPQQMIYGVNSTQSLAMSNYSSIRVGNVELSYVAEYLASWSGSQCMPQPPSYTNCGNGSAAPGMKWIMVALFVQNLDNDRSVNWPYLNAEFCYGNVCNQQKNMGLGGNLNPGENWGSASTVFQINSTSFLTSVDYLGLLGFSNSTA